MSGAVYWFTVTDACRAKRDITCMAVCSMADLVGLSFFMHE
jgi:hypothetical protein